MHRMKRSLFVLLALILLPLSPARAQQTDDILWSGKITEYWTHRAAWSLPGGHETLEGSLQESFTGIIFPSGKGWKIYAPLVGR